jgi:hypothetical protein
VDVDTVALLGGSTSDDEFVKVDDPYDVLRETLEDDVAVDRKGMLTSNVVEDA